jgi:hypothetical protein
VSRRKKVLTASPRQLDLDFIDAFGFRAIAVVAIGLVKTISVLLAVGGILRAAAGSEFEGVARAFVGKHCVACHGSESQEGGIRLHDLSTNLSDHEAAEIWRRVLEQVLFSEMPPADSDSLPNIEQRMAFVNVVEAELTNFGNGLNLDEKLLLPNYGNFVSHEKLFDSSVTEKPYTPARLWRQRPDIYRRIWGKQYGQKHWYSVKIGGSQRKGELFTVHHGPHKGKAISGRYFADERFANPFYEYVHHAAGFTDYATIVADQASLESLLINAETMAEILTLGTKVTIVTEVKSKDSRHGNNHGSFVGGVETISLERRGKIPAAFVRVMESPERVERSDFRAALDVAFELFLRRRPTDADESHYWENVFQRNAELGHTMALQAVLIYITISPEFVYRMEMGLGEPDNFGRRILSPHELVFAIHYALDNTPAFGVDEFEREEVYLKNSEPLVRKAMTEEHTVSYAKDSWVAGQMKTGGLNSREDVERVVRSLLDRRNGNMTPNHNRTIESVANPRILQFFREFFGYHRAATVFKDVDKFVNQDGYTQFHSHTATRMMYDTDALILQILAEDKDVLRELLTTNKVCVSYWNGANADDQVKRAGGLKKYAANHDAQSYNLDPLEYQHDRGTGAPIEVAADQRCGILTQPSWLVAHSGNFDNDPVRRGKWIREKLLASYIMDIPITVDAQIPDDDTKTLRERFSVVHGEACWRCHKKMNPLGMPFEAFNHVGRFRKLERGSPVDTSGEINFSGVKTLDGPVESVREMMERLAESTLVRQSFLRHMFRFWMGRNELLSDSQTLMEMDRAYVESGGSFKETLVSLLTSDSFLYRK